MPLYEYQCKCGKFEAIRPIRDRNNVTCPCGGTPKLLLSTYMLARSAGRFQVYDCNGNLAANKQTTERTSLKVRKKIFSRFTL